MPLQNLAEKAHGFSRADESASLESVRATRLFAHRTLTDQAPHRRRQRHTPGVRDALNHLPFGRINTHEDL